MSLLLTSPTWIKPMSTANFILIFRIGTEGFITPAGRTTAPDPDTIISPVTDPVKTCCPEPGGGGASRSVSEAEPGGKTGFSLGIPTRIPKKERSPRSHLLLYHRGPSIKYKRIRKILDQLLRVCPPPPRPCASERDASEGYTGRNDVLCLAKRSLCGCSSLSPPVVSRRSVRCRAVLSFSGRHVDAPCLRERLPRLRAAARLSIKRREPIDAKRAEARASH